MLSARLCLGTDNILYRQLEENMGWARGYNCLGRWVVFNFLLITEYVLCTFGILGSYLVNSKFHTCN